MNGRACKERGGRKRRRSRLSHPGGFMVGVVRVRLRSGASEPGGGKVGQGRADFF